MNKILKRDELKVKDTWDLTRLFKNETDYENALVELAQLVSHFVSNHQGKMLDAKSINLAILDYQEVMKQFSYVATYQSLALATDQTNQVNAIRSSKFGILSADLSKQLLFFMSELKDVDPEILSNAAHECGENARFIEEIIKDAKRRLSPEVEKALAEFSQVLNAHYGNYNKVKLGDMDFKTFSVDGKSYANSFSKFESEYSGIEDRLVRHAAFTAFYDVLGHYENGIAANYYAQVLKEKAYANLYKFDSVIDYLLEPQEVSLEIYDRQIDTLMDQLSIQFRKYAKLLKEVHKIDKMSYMDLQIALDPAFEPTISIEDSQKYVLDGLAILGPKYLEMIEKSYAERWIDFPQNIGKSTGGFCSSPYQRGAYILLNWNNMMDEVFVLAHEIGHAGHFYFAGASQTILNCRPSMFFLEAPSTMNELIMAEYLKSKANDIRLKRWVLSAIISRTYYHNCVTHLLEAHFQREVYRKIDKKEPLSAPILNALMLATIKKFWGDEVEIPDFAGRTWMRQPHYYMGLYPYTYSAGLAIATNAFDNIKKGVIAIEDWLAVLSAGGSKKPLELAKMAKVDFSSPKPLAKMVEYVGSMIDEMVKMTEEIEDGKAKK